MEERGCDQTTVQVYMNERVRGRVIERATKMNRESNDARQRLDTRPVTERRNNDERERERVGEWSHERKKKMDR